MSDNIGNAKAFKYELEKDLEDLHQKLQASAHYSFFHESFHPALLNAMHEWQMLFLKMRWALQKKQNKMLWELRQDALKKQQELKHALSLLEENTKEFILLQHIIEMSENTLAYMNLVLTNKELGDEIFEEDLSEQIINKDYEAYENSEWPPRLTLPSYRLYPPEKDKAD